MTNKSMLIASRYTYGETLAEHQMRAYRLKILNTKAKWNTQLRSNGRPPSRRIARSLLHYRSWLGQYLIAKRAFLTYESYLGSLSAITRLPLSYLLGQPHSTEE